MSQRNEEQTAEVLWKYVEALKSAENPEAVHFVAVTSAEMDEIAPLMKTAALAAEALAEERATEASRDAVRARFRARAAELARKAVAARERTDQEPRPVRPPAARGWNWPRLWSYAGGLGWAAAAALAVLLFLPRLPHTPSRPGPPLPALTHAEVHAAVPQLIRNQLPPDRARAMWAHLAWCEACFGVYRSELRALQGARQSQGRAPVSWPLPHGQPPVSLASAALPAASTRR